MKVSYTPQNESVPIKYWINITVKNGMMGMFSHITGNPLTARVKVGRHEYRVLRLLESKTPHTVLDEATEACDE